MPLRSCGAGENNGAGFARSRRAARQVCGEAAVEKGGGASSLVLGRAGRLARCGGGDRERGLV